MAAILPWRARVDAAAEHQRPEDVVGQARDEQQDRVGDQRVYPVKGERDASGSAIGTPMLYILAGVAGIVGAVIGWLVTAALAAWIAGAFGMSDFEGARSMFAAFVVGPIGGLVCMILAVWLVLRVGKGRATLGTSLARVGLVLAGIAAVAAAAVGIRLYTVDTYTNELPPTLEFELRLPAAVGVPDQAGLRIELHTDRNVGDAFLHDPWLRDEGDHKVIAGGVSLDRKTSSRLLG